MKNRPAVPDKTHPVYTGDFLIVTEEVERLYYDLSKWIDNHIPGCIVYGRPRLGKTRAIKIVGGLIKEDYYGAIPVFSINMTLHRPSEGFLYSLILQDIGHSLFDKGKIAEKKERIISYLYEQARSSQTNRVIIFIDEANHMFEEDFIWLMDIYNRLDRAGIQMTVILVGTENLKGLKNLFIQSKKQQIVGRFMVHEHQFFGIKDVKPLQRCLGGYDFGIFYPQNTDWSYTRYFFPEAFDAEYRLHSEAAVLHKCFDAIIKKNGFNLIDGIPMQYVILTINNCLKTYGANGKGLTWIGPEHWTQSIIDSGFIEAEAINNEYYKKE